MRFAAAQLIADKAHSKDIEWIANALQMASVLLQRLEARIIAAVESTAPKGDEDRPVHPHFVRLSRSIVRNNCSVSLQAAYTRGGIERAISYD